MKKKKMKLTESLCLLHRPQMLLVVCQPIEDEGTRKYNNNSTASKKPKLKLIWGHGWGMGLDRRLM